MSILRQYLMTLSIVLLGFASSGAFALDGNSHYVSPTDVPPQALPAPPTEGSAEWNSNVVGVINLQKVVTPSDLVKMKEEQKIRSEIMTDALGPDFKREKYPATFKLLDNVFEDGGVIVNKDKDYWHTRRPYLADKRVKLLIDPIDNSPSYPSGHTSGSFILAEVMAKLFPKRLEEFRKRADEIAMHRIEAGVHYPKDIIGGKILAARFLYALDKNAQFRADLAAAQKEIGKP